MAPRPRAPDRFERQIDQAALIVQQANRIKALTKPRPFSRWTWRDIALAYMRQVADLFSGTTPTNTMTTHCRIKRLVLHVTQSAGMDWSVRQVGGGFLSCACTKAKAVRWARAYAKARKPSQVIVHLSRARRNKIETEFTYGADPQRFKG